MLYADNPDYDRIFLEIKNINFFIDPILLIFGKVRIIKLFMNTPYLEYYNRVDSYKKNKFLPKRHKVEIKNANIFNGRIYVRDETMKPIYRLELKYIHLDNMDMDLGTPVDLLFRTKRGEAHIASGRIEIGQSNNNEGYIRLWGLTWSELTSLENIPLMGQRLALTAHHNGGSNSRQINGQIGYSNTPSTSVLQTQDEGFTNVNFEFDAQWDDYKVTIDLGIQKLIGNILQNAQTNWLNSGFLMGGLGVFNMIKKSDGQNQE